MKLYAENDNLSESPMELQIPFHQGQFELFIPEQWTK